METELKLPEPEVKLPEMPPVQSQRVDKFYTRKADREGKRCKPDGCEVPPVGCCIMDLPKKERKKYMWMIPDELKNDPMYDKEPEECKTDVCKMKREEREDNERKEKNRYKDQEATIQLLMTSMSDLIKQVNILTKK
jgi:hypothetical protein